MKEEILHYIWKTRNFNHHGLQTVSGQEIDIRFPGYHNLNEGPDFLESRISVGNVAWSGATEIHIRSSDWRAHGHHHDPAYDQVVLHVVWEDDHPVKRLDGTPIPTLELKDRVSPGRVESAIQLLKSLNPLPCAGHLPSVPAEVVRKMTGQVLHKRLQQKAMEVLEILSVNGGDWSETAYGLVAMGYGFKVNRDIFRLLAGRMPYRILRRHRTSIFQLQSLLFGAAGMLEQDSGDHFFRRLKQEYGYLRKKYQVSGSVLNAFSWHYSRTRPQNFPSYRIGQLAGLLGAHENPLSNMLSIDSLDQGRDFFAISADPYWQKHYYFGKGWKKPHSTVPGVSSRDNLLMNIVVPLQYAFSIYLDDARLCEKSLTLLRSIPPESNRVVRTWQESGISPSDASESQALLTLFRDYCKEKRCLDCSIGNYLTGK